MTKLTTFLILVLFLFCSSHKALFGQCSNKFPVKVSGSNLVLNDGTERRFFFSGMVDNRPASGEQLSRYSRTEMEDQMIESVAIGCNAMRWNAFLKGLDFTWDNNGYVTGLKPGCFGALRDGLDVAYENGIMVQIVLCTAHFLKYGFGGIDNVLGGIRNGDRVTNNKQMLTTELGRQAYIDNVLKPMLDSMGIHPALIGYVVINEAYGMTDPQDTPNGSWSDEYARLIDLQTFAHTVASEIHRVQPGALCSVSGISAIQTQYDDMALLAAGADADGLMDVYQYQYYPVNHKDTYSPFQYSPSQMLTLWGGSSKPVIAGEFPIEGLELTTKNTVEMTPEEAYGALWDLGYSGGFTWSNLVYTNADVPRKNAIDSGYLALHANHLDSLDPWEFWDTNQVCTDCFGDIDGSAMLDDCDVCSGGNTGIVPNSLCQTVEIEYKLEAEEGILTGLSIDNSTSGYTGSGYVGNFNGTGDQVSVSIDLPQGGTYELWISYNSPFANKKLELVVNGGLASELTFNQNTGFTSEQFMTLELDSGLNVIQLNKQMSWVYIDHFMLKTEDIVSETHDLTSTQQLEVFPNPTEDKATLTIDTDWELISAFGEILSSGRGRVLDVRQLSSGLYTIRTLHGSVPLVIR